MWLVPYFLTVGMIAVIVHVQRNRGRHSPINENLLRSPAYTLNRKRESVAVEALMYLAGVALVPLLFYYVYLQLPGLWVYVATFGALVTLGCAFLAVSKFSKVPRLHLAIDAEEATGQELSLLMRDGAWVFHDVPYAGGNIDHIVVSEGGVFAIETKGYSKSGDGSTKTDGWKASVKDGVLHLPTGQTAEPLAQAKKHASWLEREIRDRCRIQVTVQPVLALPGWHITGGWDSDCWVINPKRGNSLRKSVQRRNLSPEQANAIAVWVENLSRSVKPSSKRFDKKHWLELD